MWSLLRPAATSIRSMSLTLRARVKLPRIIMARPSPVRPVTLTTAISYWVLPMALPRWLSTTRRVRFSPAALWKVAATCWVRRYGLTGSWCSAVPRAGLMPGTARMSLPHRQAIRCPRTFRSSMPIALTCFCRRSCRWMRWCVSPMTRCRRGYAKAMICRQCLPAMSMIICIGTRL